MNILDSLKDKVNEWQGGTPELSICMMGARGVGKTSILTAIFSDTQQSIQDTDLYLRATGDTAASLINKKNELMDVFERRENFQDTPSAGISATNAMRSYHFELGLKGNSNATMKLTITDFPGEYLFSKPDEVRRQLEKSTVVMLAVDTPYLMEENGAYNEEKNQVQSVTHFFSDATIASAIKDKLVLIVPLKSELYFHQGRMDDVADLVSKAYRELVNSFKEQGIACVVTPILTMGDVEFESFMDNSHNLGGLSKVAKYRYYGNHPKYAPAFCVQPMFYLLTYVANSYALSKNQRTGFLSKLLSSINSIFAKDKRFLLEIDKLNRFIIIDEFGYRVLSTNSILRIH